MFFILQAGFLQKLSDAVIGNKYIYVEVMLLHVYEMTLVPSEFSCTCSYRLLLILQFTPNP